MKNSVLRVFFASLLPGALLVFLCLWLQLHGAIYRPDSFVLMSRHCANLKAIRYESTSLNRIVADKSQSVIVAYEGSAKSEWLNTNIRKLSAVIDHPSSARKWLLTSIKIILYRSSLFTYRVQLEAS